MGSYALDAGEFLHAEPQDFEDIFHNGMKRVLSCLRPAPKGIHLNLGAGRYPVDADGVEVYNLDRPTWEAPSLRHFGTEAVAAVHAYHFLEHLDSATLREMFVEINRVLVPEGVVYICVPYAHSDLAVQDIDHKTFFTEKSMSKLLDNAYYAATYGIVLRLRETYRMIAGESGADLAVFYQLEKI